MATRKTAAKPAAAKETKAETKTVAAAEKETAPAKKTTTAKKSAPKKVAPKKPTAVAAAVNAAKTEIPAEVKTETKVNFVVEFNGKQNPVEEIIKNVKLTYGKDAKEISIYLKPNENKAYFVADGEEGVMDVFFC